jgi:hypothetical protein
VEFEWDEAKNKENLRRHDVRFETAKLVFDDPFAITVRADSDEFEEERWITVGSTGRHLLFHVVSTWRDESTIRLISARTATTRERKGYEEAYKRSEAGHRGLRRKEGRRH